MDLVRLAHPWVLVFLLPAWGLIVWSVFRSAVRRPGAVGRAALACLAAALLLHALARPSVRIAAPPSILIVQDISPSMALAGASADALAPWASALADSPVGLVQFDTRAALKVRPTTGSAAATAEAFRSPPNTDADTDIAAALREAALALPRGRGLLVLWTDARETRGDAARAAARLAAGGVTVHAILPLLDSPSDARVVAVQAPAAIEAAATVRIRVRLAATRPMDAVVRLRRLPTGPVPEAVWERRTRLEPDLGADLLFEDAPPAEGLTTYQAEVAALRQAQGGPEPFDHAHGPEPVEGQGRGAAEADVVAPNNRASCTVRVGPARAVLYVHSGLQSGPLFALVSQAASGAPVRTVAAHAVPLPPALDTSVVVLDNVSAWALGQEASERLAQVVTRAGVGLLAVGGDAAFSAGGYAESPIEDILPVSSRTGRRPPLELVLVVDASGSMNEAVGDVRKLVLAKQAVLALGPALGEGDHVGVVAFAGEPRVVSPLVPTADWETLRHDLLALEAGGGTRITPAVERAAEMLSPPAGPADATVRHLVLLSDGRSEDFDCPRLAALCRARAASVSVVATGADADLERLGRLAEQTGGRLYRSADLARLAETFLADLAWARGEGLREEVRPAGWLRPEPIWQGPGNSLPPVPAYNETRPKEGADVHWIAGPLPRERRFFQAPLLATWRRGLGKAAAMPWPAGRAGDAWTTDGQLARYLGEVLTWLQSPGEPADWSAGLVERDGRWRIRVEESPSAVAAAPRRFTAAVFESGASTVQDVRLDAVGPGLYEADIGPRSAQAASLAVHAEDAPGVQACLALPGLPPREYERFGVDLKRLETIVRAGGGQVHERLASLADGVAKAEAQGEEPVGIYLVWAAGAVVLALVAGRLAGRL